MADISKISNSIRNRVRNSIRRLDESTTLDEKVGSFARGLTNATMQGYRQPVNNFRNNVSATRNFAKTYSYVPKSIGSDISQGFRDIPANIRLMNQNPMEFQKGVSSAVDYSRAGRLLSKGAEGVFEGMTYGGKDIPVAPSTNLAERGAYTAGFLGGSVVSPITKAAGMLGKAPLVKPLQKKLGTQAGRLIAQGGVKKLAGRGVANLSQGVPYSLAYQMSRPVFGEKPSAKGLAGDTALDFGLASVPLVGGLLIGANSKSLKNADNITSARAFSNIKDKGLRAFISDKEAFIRQTAKPLTGEGNVYALGDLLSHNKLFKEYPELRQVFVKFDPNLPSNTLGGYFENSNTIVLNPKGGKNVSTLLHEVQHAIQGVEDMARGSGNKQARADALSRNIRLGKGSVNETDISKAYNSSLGEIEANLTKDSIRLGNKDLRNNQANIYDNYLKGNNIGTSDVLVNKGGRFSLKVKPTGGKQEAQQKLNDLLNYQDKLVKGGLKESEADNISYKQYQKMQAEGKLSNLLDNVPAEADNSIKSTKRAKVIETDTLTPDGPIDIPTNSGFKAEINKIFNPIKNAPAQVQSEVKNWSSKVMTGRAKASEVVNRFSNIDEADGWKFIQKFQDPNAKVDLGGKYEKEMVDLRNYYNSIREEGIRRGLDINYLDNYLNQVWKNPPEEVDKALAEYMKQGKSLGKNPSFTKKRVFDTYSDGIKYGLKPKYTHPGQLAAHYRYQLDKAIANRDLVNNLKRLGTIVPSNEAPAGWKTVDTQLIPDIDGFRAEPSVAKSLNNLFSLDKGNAFLRAGANASRYAQQVSLSGGIPGTPMNAFTLGNMIKEVTGGRVKSPVKSFVYAMSDSATKNYFKKNEKYATMMAQEGIRSRAITDYDKAYKNLLDYDGVKGKGQAIADLWNSAMEKPTFERFMPMLELNTFKDTYEEAIKNGASSKEARRIAGETTKAWHGVADKLSRSTDVDNTLSAVFFAPTFRESMINFWGANAKAMNPKNWADPKYKYNKKFLGGMLVTYVLYNLVNKQLTGHYLHENKDGKEFAIEIPRENGRSWFIPMLPSIGTLPRRGLEIAGALKGGDVKTAAQKFGSFFSQPINVGGSLLSNRTFYGGPIYTDEDTAGQKVGKLVGYGAEQLAHPYIGEPIAYMQGRKTPIEALMGAMELPVYPSKSTYASHLVGGQNTKFNSIVKASDDLGKQYAEGVKIKNALTSDKPTKKQLKVLNSVTPDKLDGIALAFGYDNYLSEKPAGDLEYKAYSNEVLSDARSVYNDEEIPESIKKPLIERMGQSYKDVELDAIAQKSVVDKAIYVRDELAKLETPQEKQQFLNDLYHNKTLSDKRIFTDSVAEELGIEDAYKIAQRYSKAKSGSGKKSSPRLKGVSNTVKIGKTSSTPYYSKNPFRLSSKKSPSITIGSLTTTPKNVISASELKALANPTIKLSSYK